VLRENFAVPPGVHDILVSLHEHVMKYEADGSADSTPVIAGQAAWYRVQ
jgi:hypothetical protein